MRRPRRSVSVICAALLVATATTAVFQTPAAADGVTKSITVFLKAPDPAGLSQLAAAQGMSRSARLAALAHLVPSAATHSAVAESLRARGFRITGETAWSITASGPLVTTHALFGSRPATRPGVAAHIRAATSSLPNVPAALSSTVAAVFPTDGGTAVYHRSTSTLAGPGFRNAYTTPKTAASTGTHDGLATVATLQLANFYGSVPGQFSNSQHPADLTKYAQTHGIADPVANGHYRAVAIHGGPSASDDTTGGDIEVDLDQESILSTAPSAHQQAYFAPNDGAASFNSVFAHVYDDVVGNRFATAKNPHIVAMSSSWGQCESITGRKAISTLEPILQSLTAAGVTVFASSGDAGIYDCDSDPSDTTADVDYPGSSPSVISVGGSYLHAKANKPNTGTNWSESEWSCSSSFDCESQFGNGGSGGGRSGEAYSPGDSDSFSGFAVPTYQRVAIDNAPFAHNTKRLVPDITADGAPRSGFVIRSSDAAQCGCSGTTTVGGPSLSSPVSAALLTNAWGDRGRNTGVGEIHGALYSAYHRSLSLSRTDPHRAARDITSGQNGARADRASDPSVFAQKGYDTVSGVGGVYWPALLPYVLNPSNPVVRSVRFTQAHPHTSDYRRITAAWTVSKGRDPRLLGPTHLVVRRLGAGSATANQYVLPSSTRRSYTGLPGSTYEVSIQARDIGRHQSRSSVARVQVPIDDSAIDHGSRWHRVGLRSDLGGSHLNAYAHGAQLASGGFGRSYAVRVRTGPDEGQLGVFLHNARVATLNLHAARPRYRTITFYRSSSRARRTFAFRDLANRQVSVDAVWVTF
jgi:hypothetical protein